MKPQRNKIKSWKGQKVKTWRRLVKRVKQARRRVDRAESLFEPLKNIAEMKAELYVLEMKEQRSRKEAGK